MQLRWVGTRGDDSTGAISTPTSRRLGADHGRSCCRKRGLSWKAWRSMGPLRALCDADTRTEPALRDFVSEMLISALRCFQRRVHLGEGDDAAQASEFVRGLDGRGARWRESQDETARHSIRHAHAHTRHNPHRYTRSHSTTRPRAQPHTSAAPDRVGEILLPDVMPDAR